MTYHHGLLVCIECLKGSVPGQWSSAKGQANGTGYGILWFSVYPKIMSSLQVRKCIWFKFPSWSISLVIHTPSCHVSGSLIPQESAFSHVLGRAWTLRQPACWPPGVVLSCFRTVTPVWIHIWWWNDAQSLMLLRRGALLFFKVTLQISRSHGTKNHRFWPELSVSGL